MTKATNAEIADTLIKNFGFVSKAAVELEMSYGKLNERIKKYKSLQIALEEALKLRKEILASRMFGIAVGLVPFSDIVQYKACKYCLDNSTEDGGYSENKIVVGVEKDKDVKVNIYMPKQDTDPDDED